MNTEASLLKSTKTYFTRHKGSQDRKEFIKVESKIKLHVINLGEGRPVVLIHGWPFSNEMYEYQYQELVSKGFNVIGITLRGFGKSDKPYGEYNYDVFADDIKVVLEELEIENATLGGFSMGAGIATYYAIKYHGEHINRLALFGGAVPKWTSNDEYHFGFNKEEAQKWILQSKKDRATLYKTFSSMFATSENSLTPGQQSWLEKMKWEASFYAVTQSLIAFCDEDLTLDLPKIHLPVAIFHGVKDKIVPISIGEQALHRIKNSYLVRFEDSGHALFLEEREKFNYELIKFMQKEI